MTEGTSPSHSSSPSADLCFQEFLYRNVDCRESQASASITEGLTRQTHTTLVKNISLELVSVQQSRCLGQINAA